MVFLSATEFSECVSHMKVNLVWVTAEIKTVSFCSPGCPGTVLPQPSIGVRDPGELGPGCRPPRSFSACGYWKTSWSRCQKDGSHLDSGVQFRDTVTVL